ncbi:MAG: anaerobic ribonucleoside-triphosphate reductase activating protein [Mangrovibacterium sp.]
MTSLAILSILHDTTVDGPGFRTSIYAAGCMHRCAGCHNPQSWTKENGKIYSITQVLQEIKTDEFAQVTFSGGDPLLQVHEFAQLARRIKAETTKNIWCYTGFTYEEVIQSDELSIILPHIDVLVDGKYEDKQRTLDLPFRGSRNQRIIDVVQSLRKGEIILLENYR